MTSASPSPSRFVWFDANRVVAAMAVVLIHSTTDFAGGVFPKAAPDERLVPVLLRALGEFSGSEMFFTFSLFLIAAKLDRKPMGYGKTLADQARRLLVPFAVWTLFYAAFRLVKADTFGYRDHILGQLSEGQAWLSYALLGSVQYHMHFLPTLFLILLFFPVMRLGQRYPICGLAIVATLGAMQAAQGWIWSLPLPDLTRDLLIRGTKVLGYVGYGLAAFALYGLYKDGIPRGESRLIRRGGLFAAAIALMATAPFFGAALTSGEWGARLGAAFWGHYLMPLAIFAVFMGSQFHNWNPGWSRLARYTFGVYLMHPMVIDMFDVTLVRLGLGLDPAALVLLRYSLVLPATFAIAIGLSRLPALAWTIGLGPAPWERRGQRPSQIAVAGGQNDG